MDHDGLSSLGVEENVVAAASYFGFLGIIIFLIEKRSHFVRFHAMQSTLAFGLLTCVWLIVRWTPALNHWLWWAPGGAAFIFALIMMAKCWYGEEYKLPIIGGIAFNSIYHTDSDLEDVLADPADRPTNGTIKG